MNNDTRATVISALEFYADENNYIDRGGVLPIECDGGETAQDALKLIKR